MQARKSLQLSQRTLAQMTGKSQSWIRDIENGRFRANSKDQISSFIKFISAVS
jgi:predicted transcriptional regulator